MQMASLDPAVPQTEPDQNVTAKSFHDRQALPRLFPGSGKNPRRSLGKPLQYLIDQRKRLLDLAHPDPNACIDVALVQYWHFKVQIIIGWIGKGSPRIECAARGSPDIAAGGILSGQCGFEDAGIDGAVLQRSGVVVEFDERRKAPEDIIDHCLDGLYAFGAEVTAHAPGYDDIPHQSMTESDVGGAQHALAQYAAM